MLDQQLFEEILSTYNLDAQTKEKFFAYATAVINANKQLNLTRITETKDMAVNHFLDSLYPVLLGKIKKEDKMIDVGTGAGFPGVPLAIYFESETTLLDATEKKIRFIAETCTALDIAVHPLWGRAEELGQAREHREQYDVAVSRAVAHLPVLLELLAPFVKIGGTIIAYKGKNAEKEAEEASFAAMELGLQLEELAAMKRKENEYQYIIYRKTKTLPLKYPRKYATIKKTPLLKK
ncbi:MAG: 16S rRNA (guanine(527)-N(7))-methyltransferase RsmG [Christensenellaceae bacterium]|jgi:16S rRNA (guanine527-N7)-methyltransferase